MLCPQYFIADLKYRAGIVRIIQPYTELKRVFRIDWRTAMKSLLFLIILSSVATSYSQTPVEATKIDEIGRTGCEDLSVRTQLFGLSLRNETSTRGVVIYHLTDSIKTDAHIRFIHRYLIGNFGNDLNIVFLKGVNEKELRTEFWLVPNNVQFEPPNTDVSMTIPFKVDKKILFDSDDPGPCSGHVLFGFVTMLKSDPSLSGYIVNINFAKYEQREAAAFDRNQMREKGISDRGIRVYFKTRRLPSDENYGFSEYWLYPKVK